jgi:tetratricopeptide (TPR) repeat protein
MNPVTSALVHNVYGEALYLTGRKEAAHDAYLQALRLQPDDMRAHSNRARVYADEGRYREAILAISEAIANDGTGAFRQNLTAKLNEILDKRDTARGDAYSG